PSVSARLVATATAARKSAGAESGSARTAGVRNARTVEASARTAEAANVMTAAPAHRAVAGLKFARHSHAANLSTVEIAATVPAAIAADVNRRRRSARPHRSNVRSRRLLRPEPKPARKAMARLVAASRPRRSVPTPRAAIASAKVVTVER